MTDHFRHLARLKRSSILDGVGNAILSLSPDRQSHRAESRCRHVEFHSRAMWNPCCQDSFQVH